MKLLITLTLSIGLLFTNIYAATRGQTKMDSTKKNQAEINLEKGQEFLAKNAKEHGVVTLKDGLQYKIITKGTGTIPTKKNYVTVHYAGSLINGKEFDSSYKRNQPATFPVSGVIQGWTEALQLMPTGSTWELYIPASLAYGERGAPPSIGPNEVLVFKVELISIK